LAAQSHVRLSFDIPEYTAVVNSIGCLNLLEAMVNHCPKAKFYQASTSELYGDRKKDIYLNENSSFNPCSPYATSKLYSFHLIKNYRERGFFTCNGILFNHESPRRGNTFVTKKIVESAFKIINKKQKCLYIGNLYAKRDWGYAKEYVVSMWKMLQQKKADDYVIATGNNYSVKYFIENVFKNLGINLKWKNKGMKEIGINIKDKKIIVRVDPFYFRPTEVRTLKGDFKKAKKILKWSPKVNLDNLIKIMLAEERKKH